MPIAVHAPRPVEKTATTTSRVVVAAVALAALALPGGWPTSVVTAVVALGLLAGLPHGAVDHLLAGGLTGTPVVRTTAVYAAGALGAWVVLTWGGTPALLVALALSAVHFGLGEVEVHRGDGGVPGGELGAVALAVAGSGALLLPLARTDTATAAVADALAPGAGALLAAEATGWALVLAWVAAAAVTVVLALRHGRRAIALDVLLVGALGALAPPLVAFAVWFGGWHALRHTGRLLRTEPSCAALVDAGRSGAALARFARLAALPTAAALVFLAVLAGLTLSSPDPAPALAAALRVLLALTVPHVVVVLWMDRRDARQRRPAGQGVAASSEA